MFYKVGGKPIYHGTNPGYTAHFQALDADRSPCEPCRDARFRHHKSSVKRKVAQGTDHLMVDALGTQRRIRALQRLGWSSTAIGRAADASWVSPSSSIKRVLDTDRIRQGTAQAIDRAYRALSTRPGPNRQLQRRAIREGWAPPAAWDDIDDPNDRPQGMTNKEIAA